MKRKSWRQKADDYANRMADSELCISSVTGLSPKATIANAIFWGYVAGYRAAKRKAIP